MPRRWSRGSSARGHRSAADDRRRRRAGRDARGHRRSRATWSSASARATSPNGRRASPTRCRAAQRGKQSRRGMIRPPFPHRRGSISGLRSVVRGKLTANAPLAPLVWFKTGGPADWLFEPADVDDLARFPRALDPADAGDGARPRLEPDRARRRRAGRGRAAAARRSPRSSGSTQRRCAAAAGRCGILRRSSARAMPGSPGSSSCAAIPGTVGGFVRMNGGAYGREVTDILVECDVVLRSGGRS